LRRVHHNATIGHDIRLLTTENYGKIWFT